MMSSINCEVDLKNVSEESKKHSVQFVPAKIDYSGPEKIGPFFTDFIQENADGSYNTALRGRPLTGHTVRMPEGYTACIMQAESGDRLSERSELKSRLVKKVSEISVWNYDSKADTANDNPVSKALRWSQIAKVLHQDDSE